MTEEMEKEVEQRIVEVLAGWGFKEELFPVSVRMMKKELVSIAKMAINAERKRLRSEFTIATDSYGRPFYQVPPNELEDEQ